MKGLKGHGIKDFARVYGTEINARFSKNVCINQLNRAESCCRADCFAFDPDNL